jgi:hypothetical protein
MQTKLLAPAKPRQAKAHSQEIVTGATAEGAGQNARQEHNELRQAPTGCNPPHAPVKTACNPKKSYWEVTFCPESFALTHNIPHVTMPIAPRQRSLRVRLTGSPAIYEDTFPGLIDV